MNKILKIVFALVVMGGAVSQAIEINFTAMDPNAGTVDVGTLAYGQSLGDGEEFTSLSYTVTGLDIEEDGSANDEIIVTFSVTALGTGTPALNWDLIEIDHNGTVFGAGDGIAFGAIGVTGTLGTSGDALGVNSAVYKGLKFRRWHDGDLVTIDGDVTDTTHDFAGSSTVTLNDTFFSGTTATGSGTWQVDDFAFTVDVTSGPVVPVDLLLIDDDFSSSAVAEGSRFVDADIDTGNWVQRTGASWSVAGGALANAAALGTTVDDQGAHLLNTVSSADTTLTQVAVSFDYDVGAGSTLYFYSSLFTGASAGTLSGKMTKTVGEWYADDFDGNFAGTDYNLKDGSDPVNTIDGAVASFAGSTSGTFSQTYDISGYTGISSIADISHILAVFTADTAAAGSGAITIDNVTLTAVSGGTPGPTVSLIGITGQ